MTTANALDPSLNTTARPGVQRNELGRFKSHDAGEQEGQQGAGGGSVNVGNQERMISARKSRLSNGSAGMVPCTPPCSRSATICNRIARVISVWGERPGSMRR